MNLADITYEQKRQMLLNFADYVTHEGICRECGTSPCTVMAEVRKVAKKGTEGAVDKLLNWIDSFKIENPKEGEMVTFSFPANLFFIFARSSYAAA